MPRKQKIQYAEKLFNFFYLATFAHKNAALKPAQQKLIIVKFEYCKL